MQLSWFLGKKEVWRRKRVFERLVAKCMNNARNVVVVDGGHGSVLKIKCNLFFKKKKMMAVHFFENVFARFAFFLLTGHRHLLLFYFAKSFTMNTLFSKWLF